jgi:hypothetical protein
MPLISRKYIDDHDIVARYLANQLSDAERESFEAYYLEHPEMLKELNRTAQFKSGLIDLQKSGALKKALEKRSPHRVGVIATAASVALAVIGGALWLYQPHSLPILAASVTALGVQAQTTALTDTYDIQRTRTSSYDATISTPSKPGAIELRVKPEVTTAAAKYRVSLFSILDNGTAEELATINNLQPAEDGFVVTYLNATKLRPAVYELRISGDVDSKANSGVSSFLIELLDDTTHPSK